MEDYSRQVEVFNPDAFDTPVTIIGAGATGSWVALMLAKMGINNIIVYDFDTVAQHNLPNQFFSPEDVGEKKVEMLANNLNIFTDCIIAPFDMRVKNDTPLKGIVFMLTDTMLSRKEIFKGAIKNNPEVPLLIETRMGLDGGRVYAINPNNPEHIEEYEKTLYTDEEASVSFCGISQSIISTAILTASKAVWKLIKFHNGKDIDNEVLFDVYHNEITRRYSETW